MNERLIDVSTPEALSQLRNSGARIIFQFGDVAVVRDLATDSVPEFRAVEAGSAEMTQRSTSNLSVAAHQLRQTPEWLARRAARPLRGVDIGEIIDGRVK